MALDLAVDTSTPGGRLVANVFASVAQREPETISLRTREGLATARAKGQPISHPSVADRMREESMTMRAIAAAPNDAWVPTLRRASAWSVSSVQTALEAAEEEAPALAL